MGLDVWQSSFALDRQICSHALDFKSFTGMERDYKVHFTILKSNIIKPASCTNWNITNSPWHQAVYYLKMRDNSWSCGAFCVLVCWQVLLCANANAAQITDNETSYSHIHARQIHWGGNGDLWTQSPAWLTTVAISKKLDSARVTAWASCTTRKRNTCLDGCGVKLLVWSRYLF